MENRNETNHAIAIFGHAATQQKKAIITYFLRNFYGHFWVFHVFFWGFHGCPKIT